jgi:hypothetical protein
MGIGPSLAGAPAGLKAYGGCRPCVRRYRVGFVTRGRGRLKHNPHGGDPMHDAVTEMKVGMQVPDFTLNCYDPQKHDFAKVSLSDLKKQGKWTILFFYPADFTFV